MRVGKKIYCRVSDKKATTTTTTKKTRIVPYVPDTRETQHNAILPPVVLTKVSI